MKYLFLIAGLMWLSTTAAQAATSFADYEAGFSTWKIPNQKDIAGSWMTVERVNSPQRPQGMPDYNLWDVTGYWPDGVQLFSSTYPEYLREIISFEQLPTQLGYLQMSEKAADIKDGHVVFRSKALQIPNEDAMQFQIPLGDETCSSILDCRLTPRNSLVCGTIYSGSQCVMAGNKKPSPIPVGMTVQYIEMTRTR